METVAKNEVEAAASSVDVAEGKGTVSVPEKKVSRKSQHKQEGKELCTGRICRRAKLSCCGMCPCQHKRECPIGMQQETTEEMAKSGGKMNKSSQSLVVEAISNAVIITSSLGKKDLKSILSGNLKLLIMFIQIPF